MRVCTVLHSCGEADRGATALARTTASPPPYLDLSALLRLFWKRLSVEKIKGHPCFIARDI